MCFPILDPALAGRVKAEALDNHLADNVDAWVLQADGGYRRLTPAGDAAPHSAQETLLRAIAGAGE